MKCRHCHDEVSLVFVDLDSSPPSNAYLTSVDRPEADALEASLVKGRDTPVSAYRFPKRAA